MTDVAVSSTLTTYLRGFDFIFKDYTYISSQYRPIRCLRAVEGVKTGVCPGCYKFLGANMKTLKPLLEPRFYLLTPGCSTNAENRIDNQHSPSNTQKLASGKLQLVIPPLHLCLTSHPNPCGEGERKIGLFSASFGMVQLEPH